MKCQGNMQDKETQIHRGTYLLVGSRVSSEIKVSHDRMLPIPLQTVSWSVGVFRGE